MNQYEFRKTGNMFLFILVMLFLPGVRSFSQNNGNVMFRSHKMGKTEITLIKNIIEESYIKGIHGDQKEETVRMGFHKDFRMLVLTDNRITKVDISTWLGNLEKMKIENPELWKGKTVHQFEFVNLTGNAAVVKLKVFKNCQYFSTDFMLLYKFDEGWKIVSKIFTILE